MPETDKPTATSSTMVQTVVSSLDPNLKITTVPFNGQNYLKWSQAVELYVKARGKMGHLDGRVKAPSTTDPEYDKWEIENFVLMSWLINSMVPEIGESFYRLKTAKAIWDTVASTFSRRGNYAQEFELIRSIDHSEQGDMTITQYYTFLATSWDRLDHLQLFQPTFTDDAEAYRKF